MNEKKAKGNLKKLYEYVFALSNKYSDYESEKLNLYHYTDISGFKGIIETGKIYFSSLYFMNDSSEIEYFWYLLKKIKDDICKDKDEDYKKFVNEFYKALEIDELKDNNFYSVSIIPKEFNIYSASFSLSSDSLLHWRGYTEGARLGCSIKFDFNNIRHEFKENLKDDLKEIISFRSGKIIYNIDEQLTEIKEIFNKFYEFKQDIAYRQKFDMSMPYWKEMENFPYDNFDEFVFSNLVMTLMIIMIFFKNPSFKLEEEYRIAVIQLGIEKNMFKTHYRTKDVYLIPYFEVPYPKKAVTEVMLAPINKNMASSSSIEKFLKDNGFNAKVTHSRLPLRF